MKRLVLATALLLAACATPAERITDRLQAAGVPGAEARCMGNRLAARLTLGQLEELNRVVKTEAGEHLTVNRLVRRLGDADPALVAKLVETGIACAL
jgi:hypothetical protein